MLIPVLLGFYLAIQFLALLIGMVIALGWTNTHDISGWYHEILESYAENPVVNTIFIGYFLGYTIGFVGILIICSPVLLDRYIRKCRERTPFGYTSNENNSDLCTIFYKRKSFDIKRKFTHSLEFYELFRKIEYIYNNNKPYYKAMSYTLDVIYNNLRYTYAFDRNNFSKEIIKSAELASKVYDQVKALENSCNKNHSIQNKINRYREEMSKTYDLLEEFWSAN